MQTFISRCQEVRVECILPNMSACFQFPLHRCCFIAWRRFLFCLFLAPYVSLSAVTPELDYAKDVLPVLSAQCFDCHGDEKSPKGGVNLERFLADEAAMKDREVWSSVFEKIESHQMPPPKRESQPTAEERHKILGWIASLAARPDQTLGARDPGKPVLRRLTRLEYNNTLRDLFGLDRDIFIFPDRLPFDKRYFHPETARMDGKLEVPVREYGGKYPVLLPDGGLPGDSRAEHGFTNRGEAMNLSQLLLEQYVSMGQQVVQSPKLMELSAVFRDLVADPTQVQRAEKVSETQPAKNEQTVFEVSPDFAPKLNVPSQAGFDTVATAKYHFRSETKNAHEEGNGGVWHMEGNNQTVDAGKAISLRFGRGQDKLLILKPVQPLWLASFATAEPTSGNSLLTNKTKNEKLLTFKITGEGGAVNEQVVAVGVDLLSRKGQSGPVSVSVVYDDTSVSTLEHTLPSGGGVGNTLFTFRAPSGRFIKELKVDGSRFSGEYVLLDDFGFITEIVNQGAGVAANATIKLSSRTQHQIATERLEDFMPKLFRRPVEAATLKRYISLFDETTKSGADFSTAMKQTVSTMLASPDFLYLSETKSSTKEKVRELSPYELAARLSFFLWASTPDEALLKSADSGALLKPEEMERQVRRMLADLRARELSESFAVQWLRLDQLYTSNPDNQLYKAFYSGPQGKDTLHASQMIEAILLFETVLLEDRSILDFIDADYTWLNPRLASFYKIDLSVKSQPEVAAASDPPNREVVKENKNANNYWQRVKLTDKNRGGFLTMGASLTVTSLPFRTSPVKRGAWLLETVFNRPPQEPKIAFAVENDTKEAAQAMSIRERFEAHRSKAACYSCHVRLDPPGFALEHFDAIGAWRDSDGGSKVDARAEWNGQSFDGPAEFKALLMKNPNEFTRGFIEHLLSYALNRKLEIYDMPTVDGIQSAAAQHGDKLHRVILEIVKSYPFTHTRTVNS
ncbi:hypothetical protein BH11VER1_BH11VER1_07660 [soil metagenome]